jgi:hypothetical protein
MLVWLSWAAYAQTPIMYDRENPAEVLEAVVARTGLPADQLAAVSLDATLANAPAALGDAAMRRCSGSATTGAAIAAELARGEAAWTQGDPATASDHLDLAVAQIGCLQELVDVGVAGRVFRLRAALQLAEGDVAAARSELGTALALTPSLAWDDGLPEAGIGLVEEVRAAPAACALAVLPATAPSGPWVDGVVVGGGRSVTPGLHLLQTSDVKGIRSAWLVVDGDATLVVPGAFRRPVLEQMVDPAGQAAVAALVAATAPSLTKFSAGYVTWGGGLWLVTAGDEGLSVSEIVPPPPPPVVEDTGKKKKKAKK